MDYMYVCYVGMIVYMYACVMINVCVMHSEASSNYSYHWVADQRALKAATRAVLSAVGSKKN